MRRVLRVEGGVYLDSGLLDQPECIVDAVIAGDVAPLLGNVDGLCLFEKLDRFRGVIYRFDRIARDEQRLSPPQVSVNALAEQKDLDFITLCDAAQARNKACDSMCSTHD